MLGLRAVHGDGAQGVRRFRDDLGELLGRGERLVHLDDHPCAPRLAGLAPPEVDRGRVEAHGGQDPAGEVKDRRRFFPPLPVDRDGLGEGPGGHLEEVDVQLHPHALTGPKPRRAAAGYGRLPVGPFDDGAQAAAGQVDTGHDDGAAATVLEGKLRRDAGLAAQPQRAEVEGPLPHRAPVGYYQIRGSGGGNRLPRRGGATCREGRQQQRGKRGDEGGTSKAAVHAFRLPHPPSAKKESIIKQMFYTRPSPAPTM